ncbi:MAG: hypothetical protein BroJett025_05230 [Patescibacteria group bacterium]|nr:MAG: hypothetical protein BroJett025_05230 [Patescibacteria group bacterium]
MKLITKNSKKIIAKHKWFLALFFLAAVMRFSYIQDNVVPFLFDHGKDSLAILHMISIPELKFIGPWTSIPGLYFGPAWYYLLAPFYLISGLNPASAAVAMSILVLLQMFLVYRYFNLESAVIIGFSGFWLMISKSAWNPYPMTLLTIIIIVLLLKQVQLKKIDNKLLAGLALTASLGFHFSSAFAIFYPVIILLVLLLHKLWPSLKNILIAVISFAVPFIPQLLFEFKNNFPQAKAIIEYFSRGGEGDGLSTNKVEHVINTIFGETRNIIFESRPDMTAPWLGYLFLFFIIFSVWFIYKNKKIDLQLRKIFLISGVFFLIPTLGFLFLHFNLWYVYPLIPVATILVGTVVHKLNKQFVIVFIALYVLTALSRLHYFLLIEKPKFVTDSGMYITKQKVIEYIRLDAGERDFSVYTYQPDIYDFPFQYEFLAQGLQGEVLPLEFAYEPGVPNYVKEKVDLLDEIDTRYGQRWQGRPKVIYYIVTDKQDSELLGNWWGRQKYDQIISQKEFGDRLVVYTATPMKE